MALINDTFDDLIEEDEPLAFVTFERLTRNVSLAFVDYLNARAHLAWIQDLDDEHSTSLTRSQVQDAGVRQVQAWHDLSDAWELFALAEIPAPASKITHDLTMH